MYIYIDMSWPAIHLQNPKQLRGIHGGLTDLVDAGSMRS